MLLTADIGNTNIKFGIFNQRELIRTLTISCNKAKTADEYGVEMEDEELFRRAEAHAIRRNGRSPRTAKQFVELLKIGL